MLEDKRYQEILTLLPESVSVPLSYLRRFLLENKVAVMVGAGFSKNAIMDEQTCMKDWNALGEVFYKKIHGEEANMDKMRFLSILRLAQQVEAVFHRNELEACIKQALPDELIAPSELHKKLMRLNWRDVFTTNYDTLLERAAKDAGKKYAIVTNKETLLYQSSPRIIKLHGSFPNITPFVITEEDFRKYPKMFPEFVNTVRQSLIENLFCLIGFSGDDPNFLSWEGWLRDIMGSRVSNVYMIDCKPEVPMAEIELMRQRNITLINLYISGVLENRNDAFEFAFKYLEGSELKKKNKPLYDNLSRRSGQDIDTDIETLSAIRDNYNKWLILPDYNWKDANSLDKAEMFYSQNSQTWTVKQKLDFLYEFDWWKDIALVPKNQDLYEKVIKQFVEDNIAKDDDVKKKISALKISLLGIYRENNKEKEYLAFEEDLLNEDRRLWDSLMVDKFYYTCCLWNLEHTEYDKVQRHLKDWNVQKSNYRGVLWFSSILYEIGKGAEALNLLQDAYQWIKNRILNTDRDKAVTQSYKSFVENQVNRVKASYVDDSELMAVIRALKGLRDKEKDDSFPRIGNRVVQEHGFGVDDIITHIYVGGSRHSNEDLYDYRLIKLFERLGVPMTSLYQDAFVSMGVLVKANPMRGLQLSLRTKKVDILKQVLTRENLSHFSVETTRDLINFLFNELDKKQAKEDLRYRKIRLEALSYLIVKSDKEQRKKFFDILVELFYSDDDAYSRSYLNRLYGCMSVDEIKNYVLPHIFSRTIKIRRRNESIELPELYKNVLEETKLPDVAINCIEEGLNNNVREVVRLSKFYAYYAYFMDATKDQKTQLRAILGRIRAAAPMKNTYLYLDVPFDPKFDANIQIEDVRDELVNKFVEGTYIPEGKEDFVDIFKEALSDLSDIGNYLRKEDVEKIIVKATDFLKTNKDSFFKNFDEGKHLPIFDIHGKVDKIISYMTSLLSNINKEIREELGKEILQDLYDVICIYDDRGITSLPLKIRINQIIKKIKDKELREIAFRDILSQEESLRDAARYAIALLVENEVSIQGELTKLTGRASHYNGASFYLKTLSLLVTKNGMGKKIHSDLFFVMDTLYSNAIDNSIPESEKMDAIHGVCVLAGCCSKDKKMMSDKKLSPIIEKWRQYSLDENNFNDVRYGFEQGELSCF